MIDLDLILLVSAVVVLVAIVAARIGSRVGLPSLLLFLALGMVLGESGFGIHFGDADLARALGFGALVVILAEGGLTTKWADIRSSTVLATVLATVGVGISVGLMTLFGHYVLGLDVWIAVLLGAVTSPTDAAAVFSVLRHVPIPQRLRGVLEAESGLNDAPTVLLVGLASAVAVGRTTSGGVPGIVGLILLELVAGLAIGVALGWLGVQLLRRVALPSSGLYPLAALVWAILAYGVGAKAHTSGFAAVYACALMLGNAQLPHRAATRSFAEGLGWLAQIGLFVMLGLLLSPGRLDVQSLWHALVVGALLTVLARPLSVLVSTVWDRLSLREMAFVSWAGLRGAVPIVLATIPLAEGLPGATDIFDIVFVLVVVDTIVTGPTLPWVAARLGLLDADATRDLEIESAPLERIAADLLQIRISRRSRMHGVEVAELRLPQAASVALIVREGHTEVPSERTVLRRGDELLVVTPRRLKQETEDRLRAVSLRGRLANWLA
jgi:cell volume regulation protein A